MERPGSAARPHARDDSWTDAATAALIDAWGERYLRQNRGILRLKDWKEIADAVNFGAGAAESDGERKPARIWSDVQCKNRVDTLKKKFKLERSKPSPSPWQFFARLDHLVGCVVPVSNGGGERKRKPRPKPASASPEVKPIVVAAEPVAASPQSSVGDDDEDEGSDVAGGLAGALLGLGEVYARIERSKQRAMVELERQRIEFSKEIEFKRLTMLMDFQVEIERSRRKRAKRGAGSASAGKNTK